jgi:hypothetical protein
MIQKTILMVLSIAAWLLTSCGNSGTTIPDPLAVPNPSTNPPVVNPPSARVGELMVETYACRWGGSAEEVFATLVLRNKSNKNVTAVKITVTFQNTLGQQASQTYDFVPNLVPDTVNFKGPNIVEARLKWASGKNLKSCQSKLENVVYSN